MKERDEELDRFLETLRDEKPSELEMRRWEKSLAKAGRQIAARRWQPAWQLIAAAFVGAVVGSGLLSIMRPAPAREEIAMEKFYDDATIERIHIKLD